MAVVPRRAVASLGCTTSRKGTSDASQVSYRPCKKKNRTTRIHRLSSPDLSTYSWRYCTSQTLNV